MRFSKPVMVMRSGLSNRIYAVRRYKDLGEGRYVAETNGKDDVTEQAIAAVLEHHKACVANGCPCRGFRA